METTKTIDVLNKLIQINNDRIEGYKTASSETEHTDLKTFFAELVDTSAKNNFDLRAEVLRLGGKPTDETFTSGKFFRMWMEVKAALTGNDRKYILDSCEAGEDVAKKTYSDTLASETDHLSTDQRAMLMEQHRKLLADHDKVKAMRNAVSA